MAVIMLDYGVGMGLIVDGRLYVGSSGAAAEFGHTKYSPAGPQCRCGKRGCIESYISDYALYRDAETLLDSHNEDALHPPEEQMQGLVQLAREGNEKILGLFRHAGTVLGTGIANLLALMSPEMVVITGAGVRAYEFMQPSVQQSIRDALVEDMIANTRIESMPWQEDLTAKGIIALALSLPKQNTP
jgi:predicted NBD/HSP70 family sugar kinase